MLVRVAGVKDHEAEKICNDFSIAEIVGVLVFWCSAFCASLASLLLVIGLDFINKILSGEMLLVELLDLDPHVIKTLEVHSLRLRMPNFLPLALRSMSGSTTSQGMHRNLPA